MKGLYFYKLSSPYQEDITKDYKLTINEIDHNFITLKNTDIKDISFDDEKGILTLSQINGEQFIANIDLSHYTKDFNVKWDNENKCLVFSFNGKEIKIDEFITSIIDDSIKDIIHEIISETNVDSTLQGNGLPQNPLRINPLELTGTYKLVESLVDKTKGEVLPKDITLEKGVRYLTLEKYNRWGNLYNFESVQKINHDLKNGWRIPSKEDWDDMLNAVELCEIDRNHDSEECNSEMGKYAGLFLKSKDLWKKYDNVYDEDVINSYGFSVLPAGYGDGNKNYNYFGEQSELWTLTLNQETDVYTKRFEYNKNSIVQISEEPSALCSIRLVKEYDGSNFNQVETINGINYETILMPSLKSKFGYTIWTANNGYWDDKKYNPYMIESIDDDLVIETAYYINEWDGTQWRKKIMKNGDSLVIKNGPDGDIQKEYQLIDNKLINIQANLKEEVLEITENYRIIQNRHTEEIEQINQLIQNNDNEIKIALSGVNETLSNKIDTLENFVITNDNEIKSTLSGVNQSLNDKIDALENFTVTSDDDIKTTIANINNNLIDQIVDLNKKVDENDVAITNALNDTNTLLSETQNKLVDTTNKLISNEGNTFDCANGILTLTTVDPSNTITIQLTSDYGTF